MFILHDSKNNAKFLYCTDPKEEFNAIEFEKLIKLVDVNKIKGNVEHHLIVKYLGVHVHCIYANLMVISNHFIRCRYMAKYH